MPSDRRNPVRNNLTDSLHCTIHPYILHFKRPAGTSRGTLRIKETFFLRLERAGRWGWGECSPVSGLSLDDSPHLPAQLARVSRELTTGVAPARLDLADWPAVAFGVETALLDLYNGGHRRLFDTPFSRGERPLPTHGLIWMDSHAGILRQIADKAERGFRCIKMKVGALPFAQEMALLRDIRRSFPAREFELRLDANGAFAADAALDILQQLAQFDVRFIEQPIRPAGQQAAGRRAMARICASSPIPIALDEELIGLPTTEQRRALLDAVRPQHLVLKPALLGGLRAMNDWATLAEERGIAWWVNSALESNVGLNAICQWVGHRDPNRVHGLGTGQLYTNNIPGPLRLDGAALRYDPAQPWDFRRITDNAPDAD